MPTLLEITFEHKDGTHYFTIKTTDNRSYSHKVKNITAHWAKLNYAKLGLNPDETIRKICEAYSKWYKPKLRIDLDEKQKWWRKEAKNKK